MKKTMKAVMFAGSLLLIILCGCGKTLGDQNSAVAPKTMKTAEMP